MMTKRLFPLITAASMAVSCSKAQDAPADAGGAGAVTPEAFAKACAELADGDERSVAGADGEWLFLAQELLHLSTGEFWKKDAEEISAAKEHPTRFFTDLNEKLNGIGVDLIVVPVPPKGAIYPDKLVKGATAESVPASAPYLKTLTDAGLKVIDLEPVLRAARGDGAAPISYCKTDSHPSPHTCEVIAAQVAELLKTEPWAKAAAEGAGVKFTRGEAAEVSIKGDLIPDGKRGSWPAEKLPVRKVSASAAVDGAKSPLIVVGDSHAQIFRDGGEMLLEGAGVIDHLQAELGFPVMVATSRGSAVQAHVFGLYKDASFWEGRKAVVWLASARSFTRERRWRSLPRLPK